MQVMAIQTIVVVKYGRAGTIPSCHFDMWAKNRNTMSTIGLVDRVNVATAMHVEKMVQIWKFERKEKRRTIQCDLGKRLA